MFRIVVAPDSFKESLDAVQVVEMITKGIFRVISDAEIIKIPMSDGGEGLTKCLVNATDGELVACSVLGPLGQPVEAYFGILGDKSTAVVEMAFASGLALVPQEKRDPAATTTFGTGQLIKAALDRGCQKIIVGIGGSATNDAGAGMAQALGVRLLDKRGNDLPPGGLALRNLVNIDLSGLDPRVQQVEFIAASDVDNPLCGPNGASMVYGPQKGASRSLCQELDESLAHFARVVKSQLKKDILDLPGAGAAGGLGGGLIAFLGASLKPGIQLVIETVKLEQHIANADLVITGEGKIDRQTLFGKVPLGVARIAAKHSVPVIALAGTVAKEAEELYQHGISAVASIIPHPMSLEEAMSQAPLLLADAVERIFRLIMVGKSLSDLERDKNNR